MIQKGTQRENKWLAQKDFSAACKDLDTIKIHDPVISYRMFIKEYARRD